MIKIFKDIPQSIKSTIDIAEKCNFTMDFSKTHLPNFPLPKGVNDKDYLRKICQENLGDRYPKVDNIVTERLEHELENYYKKLDFLVIF